MLIHSFSITLRCQQGVGIHRFTVLRVSMCIICCTPMLPISSGQFNSVTRFFHELTQNDKIYVMQRLFPYTLLNLCSSLVCQSVFCRYALCCELTYTLKILSIRFTLVAYSRLCCFVLTQCPYRSQSVERTKQEVFGQRAVDDKDSAIVDTYI